MVLKRPKMMQKPISKHFKKDLKNAQDEPM